jgi:hypothetical protein
VAAGVVIQPMLRCPAQKETTRLAGDALYCRQRLEHETKLRKAARRRSCSVFVLDASAYSVSIAFNKNRRLRWTET